MVEQIENEILKLENKIEILNKQKNILSYKIFEIENEKKKNKFVEIELKFDHGS